MMPTRSRLVLFTAALLALVLATAGDLPATLATRNVLIVIADDVGSDSLFNTHPSASVAPTPNLTALAGRGVLFRNAYANPTCSPSRAAMFTGRYGFRTGVTSVLETPGAQGVYSNEFTLPEALAATHRCAAFGKWHLGGTATAPNGIGGWSSFSGSLGGGLGMTTNSFYAWTKVSNGVMRANHSNYATSDNVDDALTWLAGQGTNRWCLWLAFNAPHTPYHKPPANLAPHYTALSGSAMDIQQNPRGYYEAALEALDTELGRLLASINTNETSILFLGDNGTPGRVIQPPYAQGRAKDSLYEGGVRVPFVIAGPDVANPGRTNDAVVHCVDVYATVLELAGVNLATAWPLALPFDSRSLLPIVLGETFAPAEDAVLMENSDAAQSNESGRAARRGSFKLLRFSTGNEEFYDLAGDPLENTNLLAGALNAAQQTALDGLRARLDGWANVPTLFSVQAGTAFSAEASWFAGTNLSLWRSTNLATRNWTAVSNAAVQNLGATVRLTDPAPPSGGAFYRARSD